MAQKKLGARKSQQYFEDNYCEKQVSWTQFKWIAFRKKIALPYKYIRPQRRARTSVLPITIQDMRHHQHNCKQRNCDLYEIWSYDKRMGGAKKRFMGIF